MKSVQDRERLLIEKASILPGGFPKRPEVLIPEVFHEGKMSGGIMADQPGSRNIDLT